MADKFWRFKPGNKERERVSSAARYQANKAEIDARRRARYAANREKELARNRAWRDQNLERSRAICRQWSKDNPVAARALVARRRARKASAEGHYTASDVRAMYESQQGLCKACGCELTRFEVDHIIPLIRGGSNWPSNLQLLCMPCNRSKSDKLTEEWRKSA